jgi:hypothetical protein
MSHFDSTTKIAHLGFALIASLLLALPASAVDGVREISQAAIDAQGGFPYTIQQEGSYRLTSNLQLPEPNITAIVIESSHVTFDLNGFAIQCPSCSGGGSGDGVFADAAYGNVAVRNGTVSGVGNRGVALISLMSVVDGVRVTGAGGAGIAVGPLSLVTGCQSTHNAVGITVGRGSAVMDSVASQNIGRGVSLGEFALVASVTANENGGNGIVPTEGSVVIASSANMNGGKGILSQETAIVNSAAQGNQGDGIECFDCLVMASTVIDNSGIGIKGGGSAVGGSVLRFNGGAEMSGALEIGENICDYDLSCP